MISIELADTAALAWAQQQITAHHYLHAPVDPRCRPLAYVVWHRARYVGDFERAIGCLIFGRPEATRCYVGGLTYGSQADVASGRAQFDRWEIINLARVWLHPDVQYGGWMCTPNFLPGYTDRHGVWRSTLASTVVQQALDRVRRDYLLQYPPCFLDAPYQLRACLSYCDTRLHRGTIYRAAGFQLARRNNDGIETYWMPLPALTPSDDAQVRRCAAQHPRSRRYRAQRAAQAEQGVLL